jgi:hypothetical protein
MDGGAEADVAVDRATDELADAVPVGVDATPLVGGAVALALVPDPLQPAVAKMTTQIRVAQ